MPVAYSAMRGTCDISAKYCADTSMVCVRVQDALNLKGGGTVHDPSDVTYNLQGSDQILSTADSWRSERCIALVLVLFESRILVLTYVG